jgi:hypothetical protein
MTSLGVKCSPAVSFESSEMQVDIGELRHNLIEQVGAVEALDLDTEVELVHDVPGGAGETVDVGVQVLSDVRWVVEQSAEVERRGIEELLSADRAEHWLHVLDPPFDLLVPLQHRTLCRFEHAVKAADDGKREDDPAVLGLLVVPPKQVGDRPDEGRVVLDRVSARRHCHPLVSSLRSGSDYRG